MASLSRDEVYSKMNEFHEHPAFQQQGLARLQEIDREEDDARHQEAKAMHAESLAESKAMHGEIKRMERWGIVVAVLLACVGPLLDRFGCSHKSDLPLSPPVRQESILSPKPSDAAKSQERAPISEIE